MSPSWGVAKHDYGVSFYRELRHLRDCIEIGSAQLTMQFRRVTDYNETRNMRPRARRQRRMKIAVWIFIFVLVFGVGSSLLRVWQKLNVRYELDYEEGNILNAGLVILSGGSPYPVPGSFPYVINPYGPLGYYSVAAVSELFGVGFVPARAWILTCVVAVCLLLASLQRWWTRSWRISALFVGLYLTLPVTQSWIPLLRVDFLALAFTLSGLNIFAAYPKRRSLTQLLFLAALFTKHTSFAAPIACTLYLALENGWKDALKFAGGLLCWFGLALAAVEIWTQGTIGFYLFHSHPDPVVLQKLSNLYTAQLLSSLAVLGVIAVWLFALGKAWRKMSLPILYLCVSAITALTIGKLGSNTNHYLELAAAICLCAGLAFSQLNARDDLLLPALTLAMAAQVLAFSIGALPGSPLLTDKNKSACTEAYRFIGSFSGLNILSEDVGALVVNGKPVLVSNPYLYTQMRNENQWERGGVEQLVDSRYFDLIILGGSPREFLPASGRWSEDFMRKVANNYIVLRELDCEPYARMALVPKRRG